MRYGTILTAMLVLSIPPVVRADTLIDLDVQQSRSIGVNELSISIRNKGNMPLCLDRYVLSPRNISVRRNRKVIRLAKAFDWEGRPPPGCIVLKSGDSESTKYQLNELFPNRTTKGAVLCFSLVWWVADGRETSRDQSTNKRECIILR